MPEAEAVTARCRVGDHPIFGDGICNLHAHFDQAVQAAKTEGAMGVIEGLKAFIAKKSPTISVEECHRFHVENPTPHDRRVAFFSVRLKELAKILGFRDGFDIVKVYTGDVAQFLDNGDAGITLMVRSEQFEPISSPYESRKTHVKLEEFLEATR